MKSKETGAKNQNNTSAHEKCNPLQPVGDKALNIIIDIHRTELTYYNKIVLKTCLTQLKKDTDDRRRPNMKTGGANQWLSLTAGLSVLVINYLTLSY